MTVQEVSNLSIRKLPPLVVNQIAAGEVVERPASVVKELVENALDAGATRIIVELEQGGIELIRITDDGRGIPPDELPLALAPHATSKIRSTDDLDGVATMGFRGEALASIASVARVSIRSRRLPEPGASIIEAEGEKISEVRPGAGPPGTCVTVRNLFFNTPARRKFLRTTATEQGHCLDWLRDLALAWPAVAFRVSTDGRVQWDLPSAQGPKERAIALLGRELESQLLECHLDHFDDARGLAIWGLVGRPSLARATSRSQHIFVNGRSVRDKTIQHALKEAYRGLIEPGRHPTAVLMLSLGPQAVDVNVHPQKLEVRFRDQSMVHSGVLRAVKDALRQADLTPTFASSTLRSSSHRDAILPMPDLPPVGRRAAAFVGLTPHQPLQIAPLREALKTTGEHNDTVAGPSRIAAAPPLARLDPPQDAPTAEPQTPSSGSADILPTQSEPVDARPATSRGLLQVHRSYVVTQDAEGIVIVDQHALHERVMFEALLARIAERDLESQQLLMPVPVEVEPAHMALLEPLTPLLRRIGICAEPLGPRTIGVHAFSGFLFERKVEPVEFMQDLFDRAAADGFAPDSEEALRDVLDMMACKAAVKAGDHLADAQLAALMELREDVERSSNCPHGRPTSIRLTLRELERRFGRS
ncbi:MAG: DNA mismatch repair endonuclease MutL [Phycisphaeraceae bacterium]|nr:DNA mismatch repair endonuclease MutL [Phycisphaeraceae bacterium]